jgi:hypothetical protein
MAPVEPTGGPSGLLAWIFGGGISFAAENESSNESRYEAQIKYYQHVPLRRCVAIETKLGRFDNGTLQITVTDLDHPMGVQNPGSSDTWLIKWSNISQSASR